MNHRGGREAILRNQLELQQPPAQQKFCINREHAHFSRNVFPDCQECLVNHADSYENHSSNGRSFSAKRSQNANATQ